jgi:hypothetical protein
MAKRTPITPFRFAAELLDRIDVAIASANKAGRKEPYDRAKWVRHAIEEKLAKLSRSKGKRKGSAAPPADESQGAAEGG